MLNFDRAIQWIKKHEGGYVDHPSDPGGATKYGITRRTLASWRGVKLVHLPKSEVKKLTWAEAKAIYKKNYWDKCKADQLPVGIAYCLFDFTINSGLNRAVRHIQTITGASVDGDIGDETIKAIHRYISMRGETQLIKAYCSSRLSFMQSLKTWGTFGNGWETRVTQVEQRALQLSKPSIQGQIMNILNLFQGKKTFVTAAAMIAIGVAEVAGIDIPAVDAANAGSLIVEGLGFIFLRAGIKNDVGA